MKITYVRLIYLSVIIIGALALVLLVGGGRYNPQKHICDKWWDLIIFKNDASKFKCDEVHLLSEKEKTIAHPLDVDIMVGCRICEEWHKIL